MFGKASASQLQYLSASIELQQSLLTSCDSIVANQLNWLEKYVKENNASNFFVEPFLRIYASMVDLCMSLYFYIIRLWNIKYTIIHKNSKKTPKIMKKAHLSPNVISALKKEREGISTEEKCTQAYRMFDAKKNNLEVALELGLTDEQTIEFKKGYLRLEGYDRLEELYKLKPSQFESLVNLMERLSYYGIDHETYLNYIGNLDSRKS